MAINLTYRNGNGQFTSHKTLVGTMALRIAGVVAGVLIERYGPVAVAAIAEKISAYRNRNGNGAATIARTTAAEQAVVRAMVAAEVAAEQAYKDAKNA
jgi:hypothetical protein